MSICPKQHASKSIQTVKHLTFPPANPEPLLFLYPRWFRLESNRLFHTGRRTGQERDNSTSQLHNRHRRAVAIAEPSHAFRGDLCRKSSQVQPARLPTRSTSRSTRSIKSIQLQNSGTVLSPDTLLSRTQLPPPHISIPSTSIRTPSHPRHYLQRIDADKVFVVLKSIHLDARPPDKGITKLSMSTAKVEELWGTSSPNMWIYHDGSGCAITVEPDSDLRDLRRITFEGSAEAQETARQHILASAESQRAAEDVKWIANLHTSSDFIQVSELPKPPAWTVRNFFEYVKALVRPRQRRSVHRQVYPDRASHHQAVGQALDDVFSHPASRPFASTAALRFALRHCSRHTELSDIAPKLWKRALRLGLQPDISCSNYELNRCLIVKDGRRFQAVLRNLQNRGVVPDAGTWVLALRYTETTASRLRILQFLAETDIFQAPTEKRRIAATLAKLEIGNYIEKPDGVKEFMQLMTKFFGLDWLTNAALRELLQAFRRQDADACAISTILTIVHDARNSNLQLDKTCILELLRICRKAGNLMDALELLRSKPLAESRELPQEVIETMFILAWEKKFYNVCRLFWHVGACSGRITWEMQKRVNTSVKTNVSRASAAEERIWLLLAGKVIIGTDLSSEGFNKIFPHLSSPGMVWSPVEMLLRFVEAGDARNDQLQLGNLLVERDLNAWVHYRFIGRSTISKLVDKALALDQEWKATNAAGTMPPRQLLAQTIKIPLKRRNKPTSVLDEDAIEDTDPRWFIVKGEKLMYNKLSFDDTRPEKGTYLDDWAESDDPNSAREVGKTNEARYPGPHDSRGAANGAHSSEQIPRLRQSLSSLVPFGASPERERVALAAC